MSEVIKIRKGLDIKLKGTAEKILKRAQPSDYYAVKPIDFEEIRPKLVAKQGDRVKAGSPLFYDKFQPDVQFTSPVSGEVVSVNRGERRKILEVVIKKDAEIEYEKFDVKSPKDLQREEIVQLMLRSGLWPALKQRPYGIIADPEEIPKAIFISAFDSAPLAPDLDFILKEGKDHFQTGVDALSKLTDGKIHININAEYPACETIKKTKGVQINKFKGPHPAGNVGIQINKLDPINKGEVVWTIDPQHIIMLGKFFEKGIYDATKIIALTGSEIKKTYYPIILQGASIDNLVDNNTEDGTLRYISGNVLTGKKIASNGFNGYYDNQVTVIPEGNYYELFGWASPGFNKFSATRAFLSKLIPNKRFSLDTNLHGGERAYVMTGEYEKVFPMDIYPQQLLKAILIEDIDQMEKLGIYEVVEEDMALCEFVCTSKIEVQSILRQGLDTMRKEMS